MKHHFRPDGSCYHVAVYDQQTGEFLRGKNVSFLLHSTGHHPAGTEIDASIVYADYYYLEALTRIH